MFYSGAMAPRGKSIDELIAEQGILPVSDISVLAGGIPDEDLDAFLADLHGHRPEEFTGMGDGI